MYASRSVAAQGERDAAFAGVTIQRLSTADQVCEAVRDRIIAGALPPGTPLREVMVAESLGVSRNTVREAFRLLAREGLVQHSMHRGVTVTKLSEEDVRDIYRVRQTVEGSAVRAFPAARADELEANCRELERAIKDGDSAGVVDTDFAFHMLIVSALGSGRLHDFFTKTLSELRILLAIADRQHEEDRVFAEEHVRLVELLREEKHDEAAATLAGHLDASCEVSLRVLREDS